MSLRRRLLLYLLICAPVVWLLALAGSFLQARTEVNELYDTELIRLTRQVQLTLIGVNADGGSGPMPDSPLRGQADLDSLAIVVWDRNGEVVLADREGAQLPLRLDGAGFVDLEINRESWRAYYLQSADGRWLVAAGQSLHERDELVYGLIGSQLLPWLVMLPILMIAMGWAVREALAPMRSLSDELARRGADELQPLPARDAPVELRPLLEAMNGLFDRITATLARERRFTADAAHELRTPWPCSAPSGTACMARARTTSVARPCGPCAQASTAWPGWWTNCCACPGSKPPRACRRAASWIGPRSRARP